MSIQVFMNKLHLLAKENINQKGAFPAFPFPDLFTVS